MRYPEGQLVATGDLVWFNEGVNVGRISKIIDQHSQFAQYGVDEAGVFICFDLSGETSTLDAFTPALLFADEGVGLLDHEEELLMKRLHRSVLQKCPEFKDVRSFRVSIRAVSGKGGSWERHYLVMPGTEGTRCFHFPDTGEKFDEVTPDWGLQM